jgi:hypothetical protein
MIAHSPAAINYTASVGDDSKVNWDNLHGKMSEDIWPYKIGMFFKDSEF